MSVSGALSTTNSPTVTFAGLGSGININSIINALVAGDQSAITTLQDQQTAAQNQESVYGQLQTDLQALQSDASSLSTASALNSLSASSSNSSVASLSMSSTSSAAATAGNYTLSVSKLAQAQVVATSAQTDVTSGLNQTGTIEVNGHAVGIVATDSLTAIAQKINGLSAGVTASLINGGSGSAYLTLTSGTSGVAGAMQLSDLSGSVLNNLGVLSGSPAVANPITNGVASQAFSSQTAILDTVTGASTGASTIQVNGINVSIDPSSQSLQQIAGTINAANTGATATVVTSAGQNGASTTYTLQLTGTSGTPTLTDSNNVLQQLGILQQAPANQLVKAQDAAYTLNNVSLTSGSNTITTVIPGATLTLLGDPATTGTSTATSTLSVSQNVNGATSTINQFVSDYNTLASYVASNSTFNASTGVSGPLLGDPVAQSVMSQLNEALFSNVNGLSGNYTNLASVGFALSQSGTLSVDSSTLTTALQSAPSQVAALFAATGTSTNSNLTYVSSGNQTQPSGSSGYEVNISQAATQSSYVGQVAQTSATTAAETLTFNGALFSNTAYSLSIPIGSQASDIVNLINNDSTLKNTVTASLNNSGQLVVTSQSYGANSAFTLYSNQPATTSDSGVGNGMQGTFTAGVDVEGTIDGEPATGAGQFLTGDSSNVHTPGLQIQYTGSATGSVGSMTFTTGIASVFNSLISSMTAPNTGLIAAATAGLQSQYTDIGTEITNNQTLLQNEIANLQNEYNAMDSAVVALQNQGNQMDEILGITPTSTSSSSSSSSAPATQLSNSVSTNALG